MKTRILLAIAPLVVAGAIWSGIASTHSRHHEFCFEVVRSPNEPSPLSLPVPTRNGEPLYRDLHVSMTVPDIRRLYNDQLPSGFTDWQTAADNLWRRCSAHAPRD